MRSPHYLQSSCHNTLACTYWNTWVDHLTTFHLLDTWCLPRDSVPSLYHPNSCIAQFNQTFCRLHPIAQWHGRGRGTWHATNRWTKNMQLILSHTGDQYDWTKKNNFNKSSQNLWSDTTSDLIIPRVRRATYGCRAFSVAVPVCWNGLPDYLKSPDLSFDPFKRQLKTFLFCAY